jgi:hypothetical protein
VLLAFTVAVFAVYAASPIIQSGDSRLVLYESDSLMKQGNLEVSEFGPIVHGWPCYRHDGDAISRYPWGAAVVSTPFFAVSEAGSKLVGSPLDANFRSKPPRLLEKDIASAIVALAALAIVLLTLEMTGRLAPALVAGTVFALGTSFWSTASRGLWQHGPVVLFTTLGLWCLVRGRRLRDWRWSAIAGLPLGMAFVVRPTLACAIGLAGLVLLFTDRKALLWYCVAAASVVLPSVVLNLVTYGTLIVPVYLPGQGPVNSGISPTLGDGLVGTMVSPGRGLLVFTPFLVLSLVGVWLRRKQLNGLDIVAVGSILFLWYATANTVTWEGGASYGPRYLTDTLPFFAYFIAPVFGLVVRPLRTYTPAVAALAAALLLTVAWSGLVHARGALSWSTQLWNSQPETAYVGDRHRIWSWHDPQFFRGGHATYDDLYPPAGLPAVTTDQLCIYPETAPA